MPSSTERSLRGFICPLRRPGREAQTKNAPSRMGDAKEAAVMNDLRASRANVNQRGRASVRCNETPSPTSNCKGLTKKLRAIDFAIVETVLYLDAYPDCAQALNYYHKLIAQRESLASMINETCAPINSMSNKSRSRWQWVDGPWPWESDAN